MSVHNINILKISHLVSLQTSGTLCFCMKNFFNLLKSTSKLLTVDIHNHHLKTCSLVNKIIVILEKTNAEF